METRPEQIKVILATDCGSTTSKARLFMKMSDEYRFVASGEAPTTVEAPYEDVTVGVRNAIREVEELTGHSLMNKEGIITPSCQEKKGVDLYVTTSSAGGGLQMLVAGVIKSMTAESAERAALGAGAIVMDVIAYDDGREAYQKIRRIRSLRPDMILVAGGIDGGTVSHVAETVDLIKSAEPKARLGASYELPVIFAGNVNARPVVKEALDKEFALKIVDNIRPLMELENPEPARDAVHELFMEHVMSHAPGYTKLMRWTDVPIMPTPAGEGKMFRTLADLRGLNLIGVGLGGATTNIYSVFKGKFVRTVSANLGMSYSICNVLRAAGIENTMRWLPFEIDPVELENILRNKMIRPTTIPQTMEELIIEHAVAREALQLAFLHHKYLARSLRGIHLERTISDIFEQRAFEETYIEMLKIDLIAGTGGLLSHCPRRAQAALILMDGFQPEGVTDLIVDSVFMMPHLGVLSTVHPKAAVEIFEKDCLVRLGTCIAPKGQAREGDKAVTVRMTMPDGTEIRDDLLYGEIRVFPLKENEQASIEIQPARGFDVGAGAHNGLKKTVEGGLVGLIVDTRGRPLTLPENLDQRRKQLNEWSKAMNAYSQDALKGF